MAEVSGPPSLEDMSDEQLAALHQQHFQGASSNPSPPSLDKMSDEQLAALHSQVMSNPGQSPADALRDSQIQARNAEPYAFEHLRPSPNGFELKVGEKWYPVGAFLRGNGGGQQGGEIAGPAGAGLEQLISAAAGMKKSDLSPRGLGDAAGTTAADALVPGAAGLVAGGATSLLPVVGPPLAPYVATAAAAYTAKQLPQIENAIHRALGVGKQEDRSGYLDAALVGLPMLGSKLAAVRTASKAAALESEAASVSAAQERLRTSGSVENLIRHSQDAGIPLRADEINPTSLKHIEDFHIAAENDPQAAIKLQEARNADLVSKVKAMPGINKAQAAMDSGDFSMKDFLNEMKDAHGKSIEKLTDQAKELARQQQFRADPILQKLQQELGNSSVQFDPSSGRVLEYQLRGDPAGGLARAYNQLLSDTSRATGELSSARLPDASVINQAPARLQGLQPSAAGGSEAGITLTKMRKFLDTAKENANFDSQNPTPIENSWRRIYGASSEHFENTVEGVFKSNGQPKLGAQFKAARDNFKDAADAVTEMRGLIDQNPMNASRALLKPNKPMLAEQVMDYATPKQRDVLKGLYLQNLFFPYLEETPGQTGFGAKSAAKEWSKVKMEPRFVNAIFDPKEVKDINALLDVAKAMEARPRVTAEKAPTALVEKAVKIVSASQWDYVKNLVTRLFGRTAPSLESQVQNGFQVARTSLPTTQGLRNQSAAQSALSQKFNNAMPYGAVTNAFPKNFLGNPSNGMPLPPAQNGVQSDGGMPILSPSLMNGQKLGN